MTRIEIEKLMTGFFGAFDGIIFVNLYIINPYTLYMEANRKINKDMIEWFAERISVTCCIRFNEKPQEIFSDYAIFYIGRYGLQEKWIKEE